MSTEKQKAASKRYYAKHRAKVIAKVKIYYRNKPHVAKKARRKALGIVGEAPYPAPQNCEACGRLLKETGKGPSFDHCHLTGLFRGWLCSRCNMALGLVGDNRDGVARLLEYITVAYERINERLMK